MQTTTTEDEVGHYVPEHLNKWTLPSDYGGARWYGYYCAPVGIHRDSDVLTQSNWAEQWKALKGLRADVPDEDSTSPVQVTENHWAVGWVSWVAIHESNAAALKEADELAASLGDYPVLNDEDHSAREWEAYGEAWQWYGAREFIGELKNTFGLGDDTVDRIQESDDDKLREFFESCVPSGEYFTPHSDGVSIRTDSAVHHCTRAMLATFLRAMRKG